MNAKDRLRERIEDLTEEQAAEVMRFVEGRLANSDGDAFDVLLETAPVDDERLSAEEEDSVGVGLKDYADGRVTPLEDARRELLGGRSGEPTA